MIIDSNGQPVRTSESESMFNDHSFLQFYVLALATARPLNNLAESQLENLLIEGGLLEIYVDQIKLLTKLVNSSRRSNSLLDVRSMRFLLFIDVFFFL